MRRMRRPAISVLSIGGRQLKEKPDAPLRNASVQLIIQAAFMMVYTYALTHILLRTIQLPVDALTLVSAIVATFIFCLIFLKFKRAFTVALGVLVVIVVPALIWPDVKLFHLIGQPLRSLIDEIGQWFYSAFYQIQVPDVDYSGVSTVFAVVLSLFMFTWINLSAAPFAMGLVVSIAYGLGEFLDKGVHGAEIKVLYLLAMLVVLRFLAERKPSGTRYATLGEMTDRKMKLSSGEASRRNWAALSALFMTCLIFLLNVALPTDFFHNQWLDDRISRMVGKKYGYGDQPIEYKEFSLKEFGYYPLETKIGGTAKPSSAPFLSIETDGRPLWLKGSAYRTYTGQGWIPESMNPNWMFGHRANKEAQGKHIGVPHVNDDDFMRLVLRETRISIHPEQDQQVVFQSGRPRQFERFGSTGAFSSYFNTAGQMYLDKLVPKEGYTSTGQSFNALHLLSAENIQRLNVIYNVPIEESQQLTAEERAPYLELPSMPALETNVMQFDEALHRAIYRRDQAITDADVIGLIRETLATRLTYSLVASSPAENEEFVGWFLHEGKGYCTFFATAMTVLAREANIPARYVEGFLVPATKPGATQQQVLTGRNAHAWCEVWISGAGWIPIDATPGDALDDLARTDYAKQREEKKEEPLVTEPPETTEPSDPVIETVPDPTPNESGTEPTGGGGSTVSLKWLLYLVPFLLYLSWRHYIYKIRHREDYIERKLSRWGVKELVIRITWDIFALWELKGEKRDECESVRNFILRVENKRLSTFPTEFLRFIERALYAPEGTPVVRDDESLRTLLDFYRDEELKARKSVDRWRWVFGRWLTSKRQPF